MKQLSEYFMESMFSYLFDLGKENVATEIQQAIDNSNETASVDGDKKVIKSKRIFICSKDGQTAIWLNDTKGVNNPHIYVIPNKEWKFIAQDIIIAPEQPIDASLINIDGSNLKKVSLMRNTLNVLDCLKGCSIDVFSVYMGDVKPGFENAIRSLNVKRMEYMYSIAYPGLFFDPNASLNCNELAIRGCKYIANGRMGSKKGDQVTTDNCPHINELTSLLKNNPSVKVIINWQFDGVYAQARLEDDKLAFNQLGTDNPNTAFKKCK